MAEEKFTKLKYCLLGEGAVGKTSLIRRFVTDQFDDRYITTIGTKVSKKTVHTETDEGPMRVDMMIWDIMGQQGYRNMLQDSYFSGAAGAFAICDATRVDTLTSMQSWIDGIRNVCGPIPVILLANKADLTDMTQITPEDLDAAAEKNGASSYFTSAKTRANVEKSFLDLVNKSLG
ncbi:MAG: GTP-binding protein [Thermoplasmata archaeon]|nr:GTP-binding protein [Thermoplasmata archaeon]